MAVNDMVVRILGDSRSVERAFARSSNAANQFNRDVTTTGKKIDANAKRFSSFAKGTAVGFGGAFALSEGIRSIKSLAAAAAESQQVLGQTRVALESTGASWAQYGQRIQETVQAQSKLGFDDEALLRTFSLFQRNTEDVGKALRLNNLAMDVARARFIDLEQAANLVNKAALGQAGALRRLGIDAKTGASSMELLTLLTEKYGGAAEKAAGDAATAFDRMNVQLENAKEGAGELALPVMTNLAKVVGAAADAVTRLTDALGGMERQSDRLTAGDFFSSILDIPEVFRKSLVPPWEWDDVASSQRAAADRAFQQAFASFGQDGTFNIAAIRASLNTAPFRADGFIDLDAIRSQMKGLSGESKGAAAAAREIIAQARGDLETVLAEQVKRRDQLGKNLAVARATFRDQKKIDDVATRFARAQAEVINTEQQIAANAEQAREAAKATAAAEKATTDAAKRAAAERATRLRLARQAAAQASQFRALGLSASGDEIVPGIKNLQTRIAGALRRISGGELDVSSKLVDRLKLARKLIRKEGGALTEDTRRAINDLIQTVTSGQEKLDKLAGGGGPLTKTTSLRANKILAGLGLTPDLERELRARLSSFNSAGVALAGGRRPNGNFVGGVPVVQSNVTVQMDGQVVARSVTKSQQKRKRRNPVQKRGPSGGV